MTIKIVCRYCGFVLYEGDKPMKISSIVKKWNRRCPCCLSKLSSLVEEVEVGINNE